MATCHPDTLARPAIPDLPAVQREVRRQRAIHWHAGGARLLAALVAAWERAVAAPLRRRRAARRARRELERLDAHMLRDIGIYRDDGADITGPAGRRVPLGLHLGPRRDDFADLSGGRIYPRVPAARHDRPRELP